MANYRSLTGGFFSSTPMDKSSGPVSIRMNNPGAVNGAAWERVYPGYVSEIETTPGNRSTIFETPEQGVAVWYELMKKYRAAGANTVEEIIIRYGGGQANYATSYVPDVVKRTGLAKTHDVKLEGDDETLLKFAKAMFRHEAGKDTPLNDTQILFGFQYARDYAKTGIDPDKKVVVKKPSMQSQKSRTGFWASLFALFALLFGPKKLKFNRILVHGMEGDDVRELQERLSKLGFVDIVVDGEFGDVTEKAVREFQQARNIDPDGEVGDMTVLELNTARSAARQPPLLPPPGSSNGQVNVKPVWYQLAEKDIGFRETGNNRGIEHFIQSAKTGQLGDPYCAIWVNAKLEDAGVHGSRSAMARSFEHTPEHFIKLSQPALGCIVTMWRNSMASGSGHVFFYDGESSKGIRGIGANEDDQVKRSFHDRSRITGYWWPKSVPLPALGAIPVSDGGSVVTRET